MNPGTPACSIGERSAHQARFYFRSYFASASPMYLCGVSSSAFTRAKNYTPIYAQLCRSPAALGEF